MPTGLAPWPGRPGGVPGLRHPGEGPGMSPPSRAVELEAPRCAEWSGKQRSRGGRGESWARESPRLAARRSRLEEAQVSLEFQPRRQRPGPSTLFN